MRLANLQPDLILTIPATLTPVRRNHGTGGNLIARSTPRYVRQRTDPTSGTGETAGKPGAAEHR
jgi:hypothetical protein